MRHVKYLLAVPALQTEKSKLMSFFRRAIFSCRGARGIDKLKSAARDRHSSCSLRRSPLFINPLTFFHVTEESSFFFFLLLFFSSSSSFYLHPSRRCLGNCLSQSFFSFQIILHLPTSIFLSFFILALYFCEPLKATVQGDCRELKPHEANHSVLHACEFYPSRLQISQPVTRERTARDSTMSFIESPDS